MNKKKIPEDFVSIFKNIKIHDISHFDQRLKLSKENIQVDNQLSYFYYKTLVR